MQTGSERLCVCSSSVCLRSSELRAFIQVKVIIMEKWKLLVCACLGFNFLYLFFSAHTAPFLSEIQIIPAKPHWKDSRPWQEYLSALQLLKVHQAIKNQDDYCDKVASAAPRPIEFDERGVPLKQYRIMFSDYSTGLLVKQILRDYGILRHTNIVAGINSTLVPHIQLDPSITSFVHLIPNWHLNHKIGSHFLCPGQRYNHIPGNAWLNFKDVAAHSMRKYASRYKGRDYCFDPWQIMPYTLDLTNRGQCEEFKFYLESASQSDKVQWLVKVSRFSHNGKGITIVDRQEAFRMLEMDCPQEQKLIAQKYIENPYLIYNRKFDFRAYLLVASMDPVLLLYHDGFVKISLQEFDPTSSNLEGHLTNTKVAENMVNKMNVTNEERDVLLKDQGWSFEHFQRFMRETAGVGEGWMDRVRAHIKRVMLHIVRMNLDKLLAHPGVYELFGLDFMLDTDLHLWFIETNLTPSIGSTTEEKKAVNVRMFTDLLDIEFAIQYGGNFDQVIEESSFEWILDGRLSGSDQSKGLVTEDCFQIIEINSI